MKCIKTILKEKKIIVKLCKKKTPWKICTYKKYIGKSVGYFYIEINTVFT